jgi:hypothetical protein
LDFIHRPYVFQPQRFEGWLFPRHQDCHPDDEPSLETLWLKNIGTMDKVQKIDRSNTTPSSKIFRDERLLLTSPLHITVFCFAVNNMENICIVFVQPRVDFTSFYVCTIVGGRE